MDPSTGLIILFSLIPFLVFIPFCIFARNCLIKKRKVGIVIIASGFLTILAFFWFLTQRYTFLAVGDSYWGLWDYYVVITIVVYGVITVWGFLTLRK